MKLGLRGQLTDVIMCVKYLVDRFRGYGVLTPPKLPFSIDLLRRPYNSVELPCDTVMTIKQHKLRENSGMISISQRLCTSLRTALEAVTTSLSCIS